MDKIIQNEILQLLDDFVENEQLIPPLTLDELTEFAIKFNLKNNIESNIESNISVEWLIVMLNNAIWKNTIAAIPNNKKLLLLPLCLRDSHKCNSQIDEYGLLCEQCGSCQIEELQNEADRLEIMSIVAEGSPVVKSIIENGAADVIIGVSCLESLKKAFKHMVHSAVPGIAILLENDGCIDTKVDIDLVKYYLNLSCNKQAKKLLNTSILLEQVKSFFSSDTQLNMIMGEPKSEPERITRQVLSGNGKRFRPFLCCAVYQALTNLEELPLSIKKLAVAVECFHKASLIHDDIEDNDFERDGEVTLHAKEGLAIALNSGDLLLGEGYRLINEAISTIENIDKLAIMNCAISGHIELCCGQGNELLLCKENSKYQVDEIINILQSKTAPAFEVALLIGALAANCDKRLIEILANFSKYLGIAYQIHDDMSDFIDGKDAQVGKLSIMLAFGCQEFNEDENLENILKLMDRDKAYNSCKKLYLDYRQSAFEELKLVNHPELKRFLFKITNRILKDVEN